MSLAETKKHENGQTPPRRGKTALTKGVRDAIKAAEAEMVDAGAFQGLTAAQARDLTEHWLHEMAASQEAAPLAPFVGPMKLGSAPEVAAEADITDELAHGGPAFAALVEKVGQAVADAQAKLDAGLVATAGALSKQMIDVVAVFEQVINDEGTMGSGNAIMMKLPLVNYVMPTAYRWTRVFLQADMKVSEFNGANGINIQGKSQSISAGASLTYAGRGGLSASLSGSYASSSQSLAVESGYARDQAAGSIHMDATLEPRADITTPKPFIVQKGPQLKLVAGSRTDLPVPTVPPTSPTPVQTGRRVEVKALLKKTDGTRHSGKTIEFSVSDPRLRWEATATTGTTTDASGEVTVAVIRDGAGFDPSKAPEPTLVRGWFNLVNADVSINI